MREPKVKAFEKISSVDKKNETYDGKKTMPNTRIKKSKTCATLVRRPANEEEPMNFRKLSSNTSTSTANKATSKSKTSNVNKITGKNTFKKVSKAKVKVASTFDFSINKATTLPDLCNKSDKNEFIDSEYNSDLDSDDSDHDSNYNYCYDDPYSMDSDECFDSDGDFDFDEIFSESEMESNINHFSLGLGSIRNYLNIIQRIMNYDPVVLARINDFKRFLSIRSINQARSDFQIFMLELSQMSDFSLENFPFPGFIEADYNRNSGLTNSEISRLLRHSYRGQTQKEKRLNESPHKCCICMSELELNDELILLEKCSHRFHSQCLESWLNRSAQCPICRCVISPPPIILN